MKTFFPVLLLGIFTLCAAASSAQVLDGVSFEIKVGEQFTFVGPSGTGKTTLISITSGFVSIGEGDDLVIADLDKRDIYAPGPGGGLMSMREMSARFIGSGAAQGGSQGSDIADPDAEFEALFEGLPPTMKAQLRAQFQTLPRDQAIKALQLLRGQLNLPPVNPGDLPQRNASETGVTKTGNTETRDGLLLYEYIAAGDRIWAVDADLIDGGARLVAGMTAFGEVFSEISAGLPTSESSFFLVGELDGRAPYHVIAQDGETYTYESTTRADVRVPKF